MPRFVLLRHDCPADFKPSHWDFMLEREGTLMTWSLDALPSAWATALGESGGGGEAVDATRLADHRLAYLDYEGPISGDRGVVRRCDGGVYCHVVEDGRKLAPPRLDPIAVNLQGRFLQGRIVLAPLEGERWRLQVGA